MRLPAIRLETLKTCSDIAAAWIGVLALLCGGGFALQQYLDNQRSDKVKETLGFLNRYSTDPVAASRSDLSEAWNRHDEQYQQFFARAPFPDAQFARFVNTVVAAESLQQHVLRLSEFFSALDICIAAEICDEKTALMFFQPDAKAFFGMHFAYIDQVRRTNSDPGFAAGLERFCKRRQPP